MDLVYIKPYCRIAPYLVGIALGYLIHIEKAAPRQSILVSSQRESILRMLCQQLSGPCPVVYTKSSLSATLLVVQWLACKRGERERPGDRVVVASLEREK